MNTKIMKTAGLKFSGIPGLIFILFIIFKNPFIACTNANLPFYDKVLNDFDSTSYFIAIDIKSPYYKGRTIIENNNLFHFLHEKKGFEKKEYVTYMTKMLAHHRTLKIEDKDILMQKFIKVDELGSVIRNADQGRNNFIATYFDGTILKSGITEKEQNAIINQLFFWAIPVKIDRLTGSLMIE